MISAIAQELHFVLPRPLSNISYTASCSLSYSTLSHSDGIFLSVVRSAQRFSSAYVTAATASHPPTYAETSTMSAMHLVASDAIRAVPAGDHTGQQPSESEAEMNARLARLLDEASPNAAAVPRADFGELKRRLDALERNVAVNQAKHYRHGVEINSTRGSVRFLFNGERYRVNDLHYDVQELRAEYDSLRQPLLTLNGILSDYVSAVDPRRNLDATHHLYGGLRRLMHNHTRVTRRAAGASQDPERPISPAHVQDQA